MMRKKLMNKDKFLFKEEEMLPPPPVPSRVSAQSRLFKKADNRPAYNPPVPVGRDSAPQYRQNPSSGSLFPPAVKFPTTTPTIHQRSKFQVIGPDPVLDAVVAKLKSGLYSSNGDSSSGQDVGFPTPGAGLPPCVCMRPLKLILCGGCGLTFPARLKLACPFHPHAIYLLDVEECKGCKNNREALVEYDLPEGMEAGIKNTRVQ